jgi:hypothetical protein
MANKKISELELLVYPTLGDVIPVVNQNVTKKLPIGTLLQSGLPVSASSITATSIQVEGNIIAESFTVVSSSIIYATGSTTFGDSEDDNHTFTGSVFISGTTEFGGDLVPKSARGATLGTFERPFREIYVSSGSINIASDVIGDPNTSLSNEGGNILVSAGGMRLLGDASFIAATGSFQYISGSMTQVGDYTQMGTHTLTGNSIISGSLSVSDSVYVNGNKLFNYGSFSDSRIQSASINTATSILFNTSDLNGHGVSITSGSRVTFDYNGVYNIQFSAELERIAGSGTVVTSIWLTYTGSIVPNSGGDVTLVGNAGAASSVASWNYVLPVKANDWVELKWSTPDSNIVLFATGSRTNPIRPAVPSIILTATQVA